MPRRRSLGRMALAGAGAFLVVLAGLGTASADPSDDGAGGSTRARIAALEVALANVGAELDEASIEAGKVTDEYNQSVLDMQDAQAAAETAQGRVAEAQEKVDAARAELGRIAAAAYRGGGGLAGLEAFLSADGFADVAARSYLIERVGARAATAVEQFEAAELVLAAVEQVALEAAEDREAAATELELAAQAAQEAENRIRARLAEYEAEREQLIARLAAERQVTLEAERARQERLEVDRLSRAETAAAEVLGVVDVIEESAPSPSPSPSPTTASPSPSPTATSSPSPSPSPTTASPSPSPTSSPSPSPSPTTTTPTVSGPAVRATAAQAAAAVAWAMEQVGKPYQWGATGPDSFDCSGLTMRAYESVGISLPRTTKLQYSAVAKVPISQMRPGDLIFYSSDGTAGGIYHLAIYAGNGMRVHAPYSGKDVEYVKMYWTNVLPNVGRP